MSVIGRVEQFFENLWTNDLQPEVKTVEEVAEGFFSAAISDAASQLGVVGLKIVTDGVTAAENAGGTGAAKLAAATAAITADLATAGVTAATHVINAAIEGAVSQLNSATASAAAPTPSPAPVAPPVGSSATGS